MAFPAFMTHFSVLKDPRIERTKRHYLMDILTLALLALLCGARGWEDMEAFGQAKEDWLRRALGLDLPNGIPSEDTFRRVFARLDPEEMGRCFRAWVEGLRTLTRGEVIALDGKKLRHSFDTATGQAAIHMVSAWATECGLALGQVKVDDKSNEIVALPALIRLLNLVGCLVTIDAMGCQKAIARLIVQKQGEYLLGLKENQPALYEAVRLFFEDARAHDFYAKDAQQKIAFRYYQTLEKDHGRIETRRVWMVEGQEIAWLDPDGEWAGLNSIVMVESERQVGQKTPTRETRFFISSVRGSVKKVANGVRAHWGIENRLHYVLDVAFEEDGCPIARDYSPENLATMRHVVLNLLRHNKTLTGSIKSRSKRAGWDNDYLLKALIN
jgi:predicted transposase YbfD/YdcC